MAENEAGAMMPSERRVRQMPVAVERRKAGRPRLHDGEDSNTVHVKLPASQHDRVCLEALRQDISVSAWIRQAITLRLFS